MVESSIFDDRITSFGRLIEVRARLDREFGRSLEEAHGLLQTWFEVLLRIGRAGEARLKMCDLANEIALTTGGVTRLIDRIVEAGYVQRTPSDSDRRVLYLELTESGHDILEAACRTHLKDLDEQMFSRLTRREAQQLDSLLEKLR
ncbi:MAG: MarR family transcriptional regulator [Acidobacteria bacterium]|nr:MarR family transcriptional regulator [Acidobacteriota bacterium]